jgi:hypothetical protein
MGLLEPLTSLEVVNAGEQEGKEPESRSQEGAKRMERLGGQMGLMGPMGLMRLALYSVQSHAVAPPRF